MKLIILLLAITTNLSAQYCNQCTFSKLKPSHPREVEYITMLNDTIVFNNRIEIDNAKLHSIINNSTLPAYEKNNFKQIIKCYIFIKPNYNFLTINMAKIVRDIQVYDLYPYATPVFWSFWFNRRNWDHLITILQKAELK